MAILRYNAKVYDDTAANLATDETIYKANEFIFATDTGVFKRGNGVDTYAELDPIGDGGSEAVTWETLSGKPAVIGAGTDAAAARTAIGAGTSSLALGATATTAKAGNYTPTTAEVANALKAKSQVAALVSPTADYADLTAATAAIKSIIDALKA